MAPQRHLRRVASHGSSGGALKDSSQACFPLQISDLFVQRECFLRLRPRPRAFLAWLSLLHSHLATCYKCGPDSLHLNPACPTCGHVDSDILLSPCPSPYSCAQACAPPSSSAQAFAPPSSPAQACAHLPLLPRPLPYLLLLPRPVPHLPLLPRPIPHPVLVPRPIPTFLSCSGPPTGCGESEGPTWRTQSCAWHTACSTCGYYCCHCYYFLL